MLPPSELEADDLLHSVARFQREMLRKREEQQSVRLQEKQSIAQQDQGFFFTSFCWFSLCVYNVIMKLNN